MQQHLHPLWPWAGLRRALYVLLLLLSETRRPLLLASPSASAKVSKTRMEIREQDFSFSDGARERPVIEVVTKDVRTADIFNIMQGTGALVDPWRSCLVLFADEQHAVALCIYAAIQGEVEEPVEEPTSWWKDAVTEEFSRQDVLVLALFTLCVLRLMVLVIQVAWKLVKLPMQWYDALDKEEEEEEEEKREKYSEASTTSSERKQLAIVRFCHLQFLLVVEKLKREMRGAKMENTQQMVASLDISQHEDGKEVMLAEILATLRKIQAKDSSFKASEVEEHLQDIKHDVDDEEDADAGLPEAWTRLQEIYESFLRIQATIIRRQQRKRKWEWQLKQHEQHYQSSQRRKRRLLSSEDPTEEVLQELQELTKELPQGFTADMFTSLGNAMHESTAAAEPETSSAPSSQMEMKPTRAADKTHVSSVCA